MHKILCSNLISGSNPYVIQAWYPQRNRAFCAAPTAFSQMMTKMGPLMGWRYGVRLHKILIEAYTPPPDAPPPPHFSSEMRCAYDDVI